MNRTDLEHDPTSPLPLEGANVDMMSGTRRLTRALSQGTGLSQEEVVLLVAAAAVGTALLGLLRAVDALMDAWPVLTGGSHN